MTKIQHCKFAVAMIVILLGAPACVTTSPTVYGQWKAQQPVSSSPYEEWKVQQRIKLEQRYGKCAKSSWPIIAELNCMVPDMSAAPE